ncbi:hypothetical protein [Candidatus Protochlamydia amoebophila]|uniref:hypothetical protein n=1 Tax=Candidatus Protochlamydia amoebophila TaxID=362787 RepID=UPI001BCA2FF1|nr:hypothetical protein [Candidatus Protochlamydia amoebophila]
MHWHANRILVAITVVKIFWFAYRLWRTCPWLAVTWLWRTRFTAWVTIETAAR